jgi:hypothetical protein
VVSTVYARKWTKPYIDRTVSVSATARASSSLGSFWATLRGVGRTVNQTINAFRAVRNYAQSMEWKEAQRTLPQLGSNLSYNRVSKEGRIKVAIDTLCTCTACKHYTVVIIFHNSFATGAMSINDSRIRCEDVTGTMVNMGLVNNNESIAEPRTTQHTQTIDVLHADSIWF